jgi:hypothetical protein
MVEDFGLNGPDLTITVSELRNHMQWYLAIMPAARPAFTTNRESIEGRRRVIVVAD